MKKQKGFVWWVYAAIAAVLIGLGSTIVIVYNKAITDKEKIKAELAITNELLDAKNAEVAELAIENESLNKQLVLRKQVSNVIQTNVSDQKQAIQQAKTDDKEVIVWSLTPIPNTILNRLRNTDKVKDSNTKTSSTTGVVSTTGSSEVGTVDVKDE